MASLARDLRHVLAVAFPRAECDADLLGRFAASRDEAAFAELVRRHGPVVLRVCRGLLNPADADDAFQATFFVLARRAATLSDVRSLGGWLIGVAGRVARQLRRDRWRRAEVESEYRPHDSADDQTDQKLKALSDELVRLPDRYRDPVVLCFLQDRTQAEAAAELGQSERTLRRRLEKAKDYLRLRLVRRGVTPAVLVPLTPVVISPSATARTAAAAVQFLAGEVRTPAATLAKGFGMTTLLKLKVTAGFCTVVGALTAVGVAQDVPKSGPMPPAVVPPVAANKREPVTGFYDNLTEPPTSVRDPSQAKSGWSISDEAFPCLIVASNATVARIVHREAKYQYESLSKLWFGTVEKPSFSLLIQATTTGTPDGRTTIRYDEDYNRLKDARVTLSGTLEPMLCNMLPCEMAHVVLAARVGHKLPKWADDGLALTATSPEHQAGADAAIRQLLNNGKGYKFSVLFGKKDVTMEDWPVFVTQSTSVVRFLLSAAPRKEIPVISRTPYVNRLFATETDGSKELIRFVQVGSKDGWDKAAAAMYGVETADHLQDLWLQWLRSDESRVGLPKVAPMLPPPVAPDPGRIPPVNLGK
jgi:RNA polymerase sigma factor (sigma-70 family)